MKSPHRTIFRHRIGHLTVALAVAATASVATVAVASTPEPDVASAAPAADSQLYVLQIEGMS